MFHRRVTLSSNLISLSCCIQTIILQVISLMCRRFENCAALLAGLHHKIKSSSSPPRYLVQVLFPRFDLIHLTASIFDSLCATSFSEAN